MLWDAIGNRTVDLWINATFLIVCPVLVLQIENEYGFYERAYGEGGKAYALWAANMALSQNIDVPWIMCQQHDAPDPVVRI